MSAEDSNAQGGQPSWVTADPTCPLAAAQRDSIRAQLTLWELCAPDGEDFVPDVATGIAAKLSITAHAATRLATHGWLLARWPGFQRLFHTLTIPVKHMVAVLELTEAVDDDYQSAIESEIIALLTPEHPGQQLPSVRSLSYWVRTIIERIQPNARPLEEGEELRTEHTVEHQAPEISFDNRANSRTTIFIGLPKAEGILVEKSLRAVASAHGCSVAEALVAIIREKLDVQVTLNLYKNTANPTEDIFAEGSWLPKAVGKAWLERVTHLAAPGYAESAGYSPSEAVKAAVAGRDGGCRAPGCTKEPYLCDVDHVHRYDHDNPEAGAQPALRISTCSAGTTTSSRRRVSSTSSFGRMAPNAGPPSATATKPSPPPTDRWDGRPSSAGMCGARKHCTLIMSSHSGTRSRTSSRRL